MEEKRIASPYTKFSENPTRSKKQELMNELLKMKEVLSTEAAQDSEIIKANKESNN